MFFCSNVTGIVCARSLHPQFYAWFAHQLAWLCFGTGCAFEPMHWCVPFPSPLHCAVFPPPFFFFFLGASVLPFCSDAGPIHLFFIFSCSCLRPPPWPPRANSIKTCMQIETDPLLSLYSLVLISLVEYGFSVWPSTVNSSLGLVLSLVVLLFGVYYGDVNGPGPRSTSSTGGQAARHEEEELVVPAKWGTPEEEDKKGQ